MTRGPLFAVAAATLALASASTMAQLTDPTRPPPELYAPAAGAPRVNPNQPQVQSILVSLRPGGRRIAVIDGKTVRQGERFGSAIVATIHSTEVILKRGSQTQTLKLFRPAPRGMNAQP
jgi:MSHA biogenesis protein MshK